MSVSIKDIAKRLGISVSTVSRALNGNYGVHKNTRDIILQTAREMGYVPNLGAKELVNQRSHLVGVLMPESESEARTPFFETFPAMNRVLQESGKDTIITTFQPSRYQVKDIERIIRKRNLEGLILLPGFRQSHPILQDAKHLGHPVVIYTTETHLVSDTCSTIGSEQPGGAREAVNYLIKQGHRRIGFVNGNFDLIAICKERFKGYRQALEAAGIEFDSRRVINSDFSGTGGARSSLELMERDPSLTAIFFANDLMAIGAMAALQQQGLRVPEDVSVIGIDGIPMGEYVNPPLTTMKHDYVTMGTRSAEMLLDLIEGDKGVDNRILSELIERGSVAAPRDVKIHEEV